MLSKALESTAYFLVLIVGNFAISLVTVLIVKGIAHTCVWLWSTRIPDGDENQ